MTALSATSLPSTNGATCESNSNAIDDKANSVLDDRAVLNTVCSSPKLPTLARLDYHSIINVGCPPDHPAAGFIDIESQPTCCSPTISATICSESNYESTIKPANVVKCKGPQNVPAMLAKSTTRICQASRTAKRWELEEADFEEGLVPYFKDEPDYAPHKPEDILDSTTTIDIEAISLITRQELITAACFHHYVPNPCIPRCIW